MPALDSYTRRGQNNPWGRPFYGEAGPATIASVPVYLGTLPDGGQYAWLRTGCELGLGTTNNVDEATWVPTSFISELAGTTDQDKVWLAANVKAQAPQCPVIYGPDPGPIPAPEPAVTIDTSADPSVTATMDDGPCTGTMDWGDGTTEGFTNQTTLSHVYEANAVYTITVTCNGYPSPSLNLVTISGA